MGHNARLFVVSGPSGAGKGTLVAELRGQRPDLVLTVSATTRAPRAGEVDGVQYYFLSDEEFSQRVESGDFLEWAWVHGNRYGTLRSEVERSLASGTSVILEIDVQGAAKVKEAFGEAVLIFVRPPSLAILEERLRERNTEDEESLALRLANAERELSLAGDYDLQIVNDVLDVAVAELLGAIEECEK